MIPFLVVTIASYTDPTGVLTHPNGEPGGKDWIEFKNSKEVVIGLYYAEEDHEAIEAASIEWELSTEVLAAYQLAKL